VCWLHTHTLTHAHTLTHTHTHTQPHTHKHTHKHTHRHTHTHIQYTLTQYLSHAHKHSLFTHTHTHTHTLMGRWFRSQQGSRDSATESGFRTHISVRKPVSRFWTHFFSDTRFCSDTHFGFSGTHFSSDTHFAVSDTHFSIAENPDSVAESCFWMHTSFWTHISFRTHILDFLTHILGFRTHNCQLLRTPTQLLSRIFGHTFLWPRYIVILVMS